MPADLKVHYLELCQVCLRRNSRLLVCQACRCVSQCDVSLRVSTAVGLKTGSSMRAQRVGRMSQAAQRSGEEFREPTPGSSHGMRRSTVVLAMVRDRWTARAV